MDSERVATVHVTWRGRTWCKPTSSWFGYTSGLLPSGWISLYHSQHFLFTAELCAIQSYWLQWSYRELKDSNLGTSLVLITPFFGSSSSAAASEEWLEQASLLHKSLSRCSVLDKPCRNTHWLFISPIFLLCHFFPLKFGRIGTIFQIPFKVQRSKSSFFFFFTWDLIFFCKPELKVASILNSWKSYPVTKKHVSYYLLNPELKSWEPYPQWHLKCMWHMKCPSVTNTSCSLLWHWYYTSVLLWALKWIVQGNERITPACAQKLLHFSKISSIV